MNNGVQKLRLLFCSSLSFMNLDSLHIQALEKKTGFKPIFCFCPSSHTFIFEYYSGTFRMFSLLKQEKVLFSE